MVASESSVNAVRIIEAPTVDGQMQVILAAVPRERLEAVTDGLPTLVAPSDGLHDGALLAGMGVRELASELVTRSVAPRYRLLRLSDSILAIGGLADVDTALYWLRDLLGSATVSELAGILTSSRLSAVQAVCHALLDQLDDRREEAAAQLASLVTKPLALLLFTPEA